MVELEAVRSMFRAAVRAAERAAGRAAARAAARVLVQVLILALAQARVQAAEVAVETDAAEKFEAALETERPCSRSRWSQPLRQPPPACLPAAWPSLGKA